jgi:hypothetical protein
VVRSGGHQKGGGSGKIGIVAILSRCRAAMIVVFEPPGRMLQ